MFRKRAIPIQVLALCAALVTVGALPFSLLAADQPPWLEIHSQHFTVVTDAGDKRGREVLLRFEQMRAVFAGLFTKDRLNQPRPLTILALNNDKDYYQAAPLQNGQPIDVPGFFVTSEDQDFIVLNLSEEASWRAVAHDFTHLLLTYNYPRAQPWFDEGLAEYFSSIKVDNRQVEIGADPEVAGATSPGRSAPVSQKPLVELLKAQSWISLPELFSTKENQAGDTHRVRSTLFYAESWIVMHYLLTQKKLPEAGAYFNAVFNQHLPVDEAVQNAYGMTATQLEQAVRDYFRAQSAPNGAAQDPTQKNSAPNAMVGLVSRFAAPLGPDDVAMTSKPISEPNARSIYADVQVRVPERREVGLKTLQALNTTPPVTATKKSSRKEKATNDSSNSEKDDDKLPAAEGNEIAHRVLAWDHMQHGEFEESLSELGDAASLNQSDPWIRYYLSVLKYRMAEARHIEIQGLANMMQDLRTVLEWYPEFADAYDLMAVARMQGGSSNAAMQAARAAIQLAPRNERYVFHLAQIYIDAKQWEAAKTLLERLTNGSDPKVAADAREKLDQVASQRKYGIPVASGATPTKLEAQKSPFDVLEQDAAKRAAADSSGTGSGDKRPPKFLKGRLVRVDCSAVPSAILTVASEGKMLKLRAADYKSLLLIGADDFSCAWHDLSVTVNFKPGGTTDGDLVSLELR